MVKNKTIDYYMALPYQEVIVAAKEGGYVGYIPELKGCITQSETKAGILDMLEDAKACWLETALEEGINIPEPQNEDKYSGKFNLRIPKSLHKTLALAEKREGVSLNQMAMFAIASGLNVPITTANKG